MTIADTDIQDQLSIVYLSALASAAGYTFAIENLDRTCTDLMIRGGPYGHPQIDWQAKATINLKPAKNGLIPFELKRRNYDMLIEQSGNPKLLMVYDMPDLKSDWLTCTDKMLTMKHRAYWMSLKGLPASQNKATVYLPETQLLSVSELERLMLDAKKGAI